MNTVTAISRNSLLLGLFAALTTALIAWTYLSTKDAIIEAQRVAEAKQLLQIFPADSHDNSLVDDNFTVSRGQSLLKVREDRLGYRVRKNGETVGVILPATAHDGYSGDIRLLVGVRADLSVAGVRVVAHRETPGLGDAIDLNKSDWILSFNDRSLTKPAATQWKVRKDGGVFDQFTGATITPRAVVTATRRALEYVELNKKALFTSVSQHHTPAAVAGPVPTPRPAKETTS